MKTMYQIYNSLLLHRKPIHCRQNDTYQEKHRKKKKTATESEANQEVSTDRLTPKRLLVSCQSAASQIHTEDQNTVYLDTNCSRKPKDPET